jgi:tetratricopeptide (TPR) repeat protein
MQFGEADAPSSPSDESPVASEPERDEQEVTPAPYEGEMKRVMAALAEGRSREALDMALAWRAREPGETLALLALGEALEKNERPEHAARAYGSLIDLFPARADLRRYAGSRLQRLGSGVDVALDSFRQARDDRPDHPTSHRLHAYALLGKKRFADAFAALKDGYARSYPGGRFREVKQVLQQDLGLVAAAWLAAEPERKGEIDKRLAEVGVALPSSPSRRLVLSWETDANDVDLHVLDDEGGHAFYSSRSLPSGGELLADVTDGYGPEMFSITGPQAKKRRYRVRAHYYSRGPMGYGMGRLQIVDHDGKGGLAIEERPFLVMVDRAFVDLGEVR